MICIDQLTGEKTREPLRTLSASFHGKATFGVYLSQVTKKNVKVSVGDTVINHFTLS